MNHFLRPFLLFAYLLIMTGTCLTAQRPGENSEENEFKGVFTGIGTGEMRGKGARKPIRVWKMDGDGGQELTIPILSEDASIQTVIASPKNYIGKRCVISYEPALHGAPLPSTA